MNKLTILGMLILLAVSCKNKGGILEAEPGDGITGKFRDSKLIVYNYTSSNIYQTRFGNESMDVANSVPGNWEFTNGIRMGYNSYLVFTNEPNSNYFYFSWAGDTNLFRVTDYILINTNEYFIFILSNGTPKVII